MILIIFLQNHLVTISEGILASISAVAIFELYKFLRRILLKYRLKSVLGFKNKKCIIVAPIYHKNIDKGLIHYRDGYSFGHLYELNNRINIDTQFVPYHKMSEFDDVSDIISVGGPISNSYTSKILNDFRIDFTTTRMDEVNEFKEYISSNNTTGFKINKQLFPANDQKEPAIILKLTQNETNQNRTILVIFGYSAQGTSAAAYYLSKRYKKLYKKFKSQKFYILIHVPRKDSYKVFEENFIDLTGTLPI